MQTSCFCAQDAGRSIAAVAHAGRNSRGWSIESRRHRIELGEIEAGLLAHPDVEHAVVVVHDERLVGYVVAKGDRVTETELERFLRDRLPEYMVPTTFVSLDAIPLTPSGKVDRRALPAPDRRRPDLDAVYVAARTPLEKRLVEILEASLHLEGIGVDDPFDRLGGSSLEAASVISAVRETFGVELPFRMFFDDATVARLAERIEAAPRDGSGIVTIPRAARPERIPLTPSQERVWFVQQLDPEGREYLYPSAIRLTGVLDVPALERSLSEIIRRHEIFRTTFEEAGGRPAQCIHPPFAVELPVIDVPGETARAREDALWTRLHDDYREIFDLTRLPLVRWRLYRLNDTEYVLSHNEHHIVHDGWSFHVFLHEMIDLYRAFSRGEPSPLPELPIQFADYAIWERQWVESDEAAAQLEFWREKLTPPPPPLDLPFDHPRPATQTFEGSNRHLELPGDLCARLRHLGRRDGASFYMTIMATLVALLHRHSGEQDITVGVPSANRRFRETEDQLGMIINNLVLRTDVNGRLTFRELLRRVRDGLREAMANQAIPFDRVVEAVQPARAASHNPLFQVMVGINDVPLDVEPLPDLSVRVHPALSNGSAKFDMAVVMFPHAAQWVGREPQADPDGVTAMIEYNTDLFEHDTIGRLIAHFRRLLETVIEAPDMRLSDLPMLSDDELRLLLQDRNDTVSAYPRDATVPELFAEQARRTPDAVAVECGADAVTYGELDRRANQVAHALVRSGVGPEVRVGICVERSLDMVVGILGILKAGGVYVPLDPTYPVARLAFMLEDTSAAALVTQSSLASMLPTFSGHVIRLDADRAALDAETAVAPPVSIRSDNLAYVMYTSGSTGRPKGTLITHRGIVRLVKSTNYLDFGPGEVFLQLAPISFDASTLELWGPLLNGGKLIVFPAGPLALGDLSRAIRDGGVTSLWLTASLFHEMVDAELESLRGVRRLLAGGDVLSVSRVERLLEHMAPDGRLINGYGPTENTTFTCCHVMAHGDEIGASVPIGRPISNTRVYLLDDCLRPVPYGAPGELYIAGDGLARGYLNDPALTAEKFVPDPIGAAAGGRLYRTGDLVRYRSDGTIEFIGRVDRQVKLRGFRIDLGEIESALVRHPSVRAAVVLAREDEPGRKRLVAYVTAHDGMPSIDALRDHLESELPDFMIPTAFVPMDTMPLTANGKIDRAALPAPDGLPGGGAEYVAPSTETEQTVASIWSAVLGYERIGVHDNFFDLGGHSLLATQVVSRVREAFGLEIPLDRLFSRLTVARLAEYIDLNAWASAGSSQSPASAPTDRDSGTL